MYISVLLFILCGSPLQENHPYSIVDDLYLTDLMSVGHLSNSLLICGVRASGRGFRTELHLLNLEQQTGIQIRDGRAQMNPLCVISAGKQENYYIFNPMANRIYQLSSKGEFIDFVPFAPFEEIEKNYKVSGRTSLPSNAEFYCTLNFKLDPIAKGVAFFAKLNIPEKSMDIFHNWTLERNSFWLAPDFIPIGGQTILMNRYTGAIDVLKPDFSIKKIKNGIEPMIPGAKKLGINIDNLKETMEKIKMIPMITIMRYPIVYNHHIYFKELDIDLERHEFLEPSSSHIISLNLKTLTFNKERGMQFPFGNFQNQEIWYDIEEGIFSFKDLSAAKNSQD